MLFDDRVVGAENNQNVSINKGPVIIYVGGGRGGGEFFSFSVKEKT